MPIYAYFCDRCNTKFEFWQHFTDDPVTVCPDCQTVTLRKTYSPTPVHFKGKGYYVTDKYKPEKQAFVWDKERGLEAVINSNVRYE